MNILILEDDPSILSLLSIILCEDNICFTSSTVIEAHDIISEYKIDVAVLDYLLRGESCVSVAKTLDRQAIPYVILTAWREKEVKPLFPQALSVIIKPFDVNILVNTINSIRNYS